MAELTLPQIEKLHAEGVLMGLTATMQAVQPRLAELAKAATADGARAAELRLVLHPRSAATKEAREELAETLAELCAAGLTHPGAAELFRSGKGDALLRQVGATPGKAALKHDLLGAVEPFLTTDLPLEAMGAMRGLLGLINNDELSLTGAARERLRLKIVAALESAIERTGEASGAKANALASAQRTLTLARGAWARGQLVGHSAPEVKFIWSNTKDPIRSFADLKGKVVVVDFWATWCGPCVASFPKLRQLQSYYEGYPVVILGVTSPQGFHISRSIEAPMKGERVDCKGDLPKELGLMPAFAKEMDVTWNVAFTEQDVFNPDFGVNGIPHVAIIDPAGVVRYNNLYPNAPEEAEKINALLKESALPCPGTPLEEPKKAESGGE